MAVIGFVLSSCVSALNLRRGGGGWDGRRKGKSVVGRKAVWDKRVDSEDDDDSVLFFLISLCGGAGED